MGDYYKINEIAKLYNLCADTLRYYEEQQLVTPARGENNYRQYSIQDICDLSIVQNLRSLDMPVSRIRDYMTTRTVDSTLHLLEEETALIDERIAALRELRDSVRRREAGIRAARALPVGEPRLLSLPPRLCYRLSEGVTLERDLDFLLKRLEKKHEDRLRFIGDRQMGAVLDADWLAKGVCNRYSHVFFICEDIADYDAVIPEGQYASLTYDGPYEQLAQVLPALAAWMGERGLAPDGTPMELYHLDVHDTRSRGEFRTEVQVKVRDGE